MKDWNGNKASVFATLASSSHSRTEREVNDYYATDPDTINALFAVEDFSSNILEPACGEGHLSKRMIELGKTVTSYDIVDRGYGAVGNFFEQTEVFDGDIITNPPYKYAQEFVEKALELVPTGRKVAMFLKVTFLEGQKRKKLFTNYPPHTIYVFSSRQNCAMNGDFDKYPSSAVAYAWYVWVKDYKGVANVKWI